MNKREFSNLITGSTLLAVLLGTYILVTSTVLASNENPWYAVDFYPDHAHPDNRLVYLPLTVYTAAPPASATLNVPLDQQECNQWCWAGVSQMILGYYHVNVPQCTLVNYAWSRSDCCPASVSCANSSCNNWNYMYGTSGSLQGILTHWGISSTALANYLTYDATKTQLKSTYPVIMRFGWFGGGGHFLIIRGYNDAGNYLTYNDPWDGASHIATYAWVVHADYDHDWTHTLTNVRP